MIQSSKQLFSRHHLVAVEGLIEEGLGVVVTVEMVVGVAVRFTTSQIAGAAAEVYACGTAVTLR